MTGISFSFPQIKQLQQLTQLKHLKKDHIYKQKSTENEYRILSNKPPFQINSTPRINPPTLKSENFEK